MPDDPITLGTEPKKWAFPVVTSVDDDPVPVVTDELKAKTPPSAPTAQYPVPSGA